MNLKRRQDELEADYLSKLSSDEKAWLNKFNEEYVNASLDVENLQNNLHNTKELKKACQDRNNQRNSCAYTRDKSKNELKYLEEISDPSYDIEDTLIDAIEWNWTKKKS